ncbi:MAG: HD domain-containing protein, partial [Candidatus Eremiobacteraeota bacterium]|nr:HD domain-containing protein [Candidatus Eremiobacteraeota bacterium]
ELGERIKSVARDGNDAGILSWVAREAHAASRPDIAHLLDAAISDYLRSVAPHGRSLVNRRLDQLRSAVDARLQEIEARHSSFESSYIDGMIAAIAVVNPELSAHLNAVGSLAMRIALAMRCNSDIARDCANVGRLHDLGKIRLPNTILDGTVQHPQKHGIVENHVRDSQEIVARDPLLARYAFAVRSHHERVDGSGYPDRLIAHEIPFEARVVAVADVFHAMTTARSCAPTYEASEVLAYIEEQRGKLFDADVVDALRISLGAAKYVAA